MVPRLFCCLNSPLQDLPDKMLEMPRHPKRRGEWVELQFMARAASYGLKLCKPWGDTAPYDVTVEHGTGFHRVQVKSTMHLRAKHWWACQLTNRGYKIDDFDYLAVYIIPKDVWYIIPWVTIAGRTGIHFDSRRPQGKYRQYREAWHLLTGKPKQTGSRQLVQTRLA